MQLALGGFVLVSILELIFLLLNTWRYRAVFAGGLLVLLPLVTARLLVWDFDVITALIAIFSLYRVISLYRLIKGNTQADRLYGAARASSIRLIGLQVVLLGVLGLCHRYRINPEVWWAVLIISQLMVAFMLLSSTLRHLRTTTAPETARHYVDKDLPPLTVAVPARNETTDLENCLRSLVASDYPKLEILVLDDCSPTKRTSQIIQSFAQSGVRFIAGTQPPKEWLAKNYAYQQLAREANGELLLFCGVDARFEPGSLRAMTETLLEKKKTMLSLVPRNARPGAWSFGSLLVQPSRYAWELALPRRFLHRPPVLSTCWLITASLLRDAGGFVAVSSSSPESYFARRAAATSDGYSFLRSNQSISLRSTKNFAQQRATAIRTRYPQLRRRLELVALLSLLELGSLVMPFGVTLAAALTRHWLLSAASATICLLLIVFYAQIVSLTYRVFLWRGLWLLPFAILYDMIILNYSMYKYEFSQVIWKGRNVCIPVMQANPRLPTSAQRVKP